MSLGLGSGGAGGDVGALHAGAIGDGGQLFVGIFGGDVGLSFVSLGDELPERIVRRAAHAVGVSRAFRRPVVHLQGKILKDEAGVGLSGNQRFDRRLRRFAGRTLQIAEFDDGDGASFGPRDRTGDSLLQRLLRRIERLGAERNNVADQGMLAVGSDEEAAELAGPAGWPEPRRPQPIPEPAQA